jgi:hypothetical protein
MKQWGDFYYNLSLAFLCDLGKCFGAGHKKTVCWSAAGEIEKRELFNNTVP